MSTIHDRVSKTIIKNLLLIIFIFYAFQYAGFYPPEGCCEQQFSPRDPR